MLKNQLNEAMNKTGQIPKSARSRSAKVPIYNNLLASVFVVNIIKQTKINYTYKQISKVNEFKVLSLF